MSVRVICAFVGLLASVCVPNATEAKQVKLDIALANPTVLIGTSENGKSSNHLRIGLTGFELPKEKERTPINVAIVIDKSGSMKGDKIQQARKAAIQAVDRMNDADIVSIITYDSSVKVVVPATKASDRQSIKNKIRAISAGGNTALFAGVSKAAAEIRKFLDEQKVNRIILLSDGLANVGPSTPSELEELGQSLIKEGISVSTMGLGLGYNEDLMSKLALASSGNHVFIEDAENLVQVFQNEFDDVLSVVAQGIVIKATLNEDVRPVKVLNYPANITGQQVLIDLGQLYSRQERYFVVEVEIPDGESESKMPVVDVSVEYNNLHTETKDKLTSALEVKFTDKEDIAVADVDKDVKAWCVLQVATEYNRDATRLRDAGKIEDARDLLLYNAKFLDDNYKSLGNEALRLNCEINTLQSQKLAPTQWAASRKSMVENQVANTLQQTYRGTGQKSAELEKSAGQSQSASGKQKTPPQQKQQVPPPAKQPQW